MRKAIRDKLIEEVGNDVGDRVYEAYMAGPDTEKPYIVLKLGSEMETNIRHGFDVEVQVWVYTHRTNFGAVDTILRKVINALNEEELEDDEFVFRLRYMGMIEDSYDDDWDALFRRADFETEVIRN